MDRAPSPRRGAPRRCHAVLWLAGLAPVADEPFPPAAPEAVGLSAEALEELRAHVAALVEEGAVPGAELLVVKDRRSVLHAAFGWADQEQGRPLERDLVFNVRSLTKPFLGTLAQTLVDDGTVRLEDPVARWIPAFAGPAARTITLRQLLTHTAGLEWNVCTDAASLRAVADCAGALGPRAFLPGTAFQYSNAGSDSLAAALEVAAGRPLAELLEQRVLVPLGARDTFPLDRAEDPRRARCPSRYVRDREGRWQLDWRPGQGPPLAYLHGAHGLGSTARDVARLLALWMDGGVAEGRRLLSEEAVARGLRPAALTELPTTFPERRVYYAQHWKVWTRGAEPAVELFGHSGSDGTFAWAWPERDLMVLYFTQAVDTATGVELEAVIDRTLLAAPDAGPPPALAPFVGHYWNDELQRLRTVEVRGEGLALDAAGTGTFLLEATGDPLRWAVVGRADFDVRFERDEAGSVAHLVPPEVTGEGPSRRLAPDPDLPTVDAVMRLHRAGHGTLDGPPPGALHLEGTFEHSAGQTGRSALWSDLDQRSREELGGGDDADRGPRVTLCDGRRAWTVSPRGRARELSGKLREATLLARLAVLVGDWRRWYEDVEVVTRSHDGTRLVVRATPAEGPATTYVLDATTGRALESFTSVELPFGAMGKTTTYGDYREVGGLWVPCLWRAELPSDSFGVTTVRYTEVEVLDAVDPGLFAPPAGEGR